MLQTAQFLATMCTTLFAGAAIYVNLVEHPARMGLDTVHSVLPLLAGEFARPHDKTARALKTPQVFRYGST